MDAALYDLSPPKVTTLYGVSVPKGPKQVCRYDAGTDDELEVPLGTTAFVSGKTMFDLLPPELKSLAVRSRVKYAPHPYVWMATAHAMPNGLGMETEGLETPLDKMPPWEESKVKVYPLVSGVIRIECTKFDPDLLTHSFGETLSLATCIFKYTLVGFRSFLSILFPKGPGERVPCILTALILQTYRQCVIWYTRCSVQLSPPT